MANLLIKGTTSGTTTLAAVDNVTATITLPATTGVFPIQDSATGALYLPAGTTAQRPTAATGQWRYNTDLGVLEYYNGTAWYSVTATGPTPTVEYLVVAGGGGSSAGGGGAGGFRTATGLAVSQGVELTVTIGAGGASATGGASNGSASVFSSITSAGGGFGGWRGAGASAGNGGSGGGCSADSICTGGIATPSGQGNNGGNNAAGASAAGGGGGAGGAGGNVSGSTSGAGGIGLASSISGSSVTYATGGAGTYTAVNVSGAANTGNGAKGQVGSGGSGIVIIRYADTYPAATSTTGSPTITVAGGYRVYKWTGSGSITF